MIFGWLKDKTIEFDEQLSKTFQCASGTCFFTLFVSVSSVLKRAQRQDFYFLGRMVGVSYLINTIQHYGNKVQLKIANTQKALEIIQHRCVGLDWEQVLMLIRS